MFSGYLILGLPARPWSVCLGFLTLGFLCVQLARSQPGSQLLARQVWFRAGNDIRGLCVAYGYLARFWLDIRLAGYLAGYPAEGFLILFSYFSHTILILTGRFQAIYSSNQPAASQPGSQPAWSGLVRYIQKNDSHTFLILLSCKKLKRYCIPSVLTTY